MPLQQLALTLLPPAAAPDAAPRGCPRRRAAAAGLPCRRWLYPCRCSHWRPCVQRQRNFPERFLYVGDLHSEITEGLLFEMFNRVGPVASIRVCRDAVTRRSLGYAYVNFHDVQDAERALDTMQFTEIKGKACRIMWSQRDPSLRKSGLGNIFVKNLAKSVDNKNLFDIFSMFGNILSCKVAVSGDTGESKGYGYVHFETDEAAQEAVAKLNGASIDECGLCDPLCARAGTCWPAEWTSLYVKQFPESFDDKDLSALFEPFGSIASVFIKRGGDDMGFGFVNFDDHESAEKALTELNGKTLDDPKAEGETFELYVSKGRRRLSAAANQEQGRCHAAREERQVLGMNLFVKNLDETIDEAFLKETFSPFGTITSAKIVKDKPPMALPPRALALYVSPPLRRPRALSLSSMARSCAASPSLWLCTSARSNVVPTWPPRMPLVVCAILSRWAPANSPCLTA